MAFLFDKFVEHWCEIYRPMQHIPGRNSKNQRFFLTDTYMGMVDFMTNIQPESSPCVIMESNQEGTFSGYYDRPRHTLYFMVQADEMSDGRSALSAKMEAKQHLQKFLAYLWEAQERGVPGVDNIKADDYIDYQTVGPFYNGWFGVFISLEDVQKISHCSVSDDYIEETFPEE